jgi:hypothetical protein
VVLAADQQSVANEATRSALTCIATALERGDDGQVRDEQGERDEDRESTLIGDPKERGERDQDYAHRCALGDPGRFARHR